MTKIPKYNRVNQLGAEFRLPKRTVQEHLRQNNATL